MKKYAGLVMISLFMVSVAISAQQPQSPQRHDGPKKEFRHGEQPQMSAAKRAGYLAVDLELTDAQRAKVQALFEKEDKIRAERQAEIKKLKEQEMAKFESERKAQESEMEKIIGAEKFQQLKAKQNQRHEKMKQHREMSPIDSTCVGKRGPRPGSRMK
ncbi:MAG: hypothetical protein WCG93_04640 [Paludibacter sp.]